MARKRSLAPGALAALGLLCAVRAAPAGAPKGEKLLLGFEPDEIRRIAKDMGIPPPGQKPPYYMSLKEVDGGLDLRHHYILGTWRVRPGKSSQGAMSLAVSASGYPFRDRIQRYRHVPPTKLPAAPLPYYQGMGVEGGYRLVFRTAGLFRTIFPADWSGYDRLRLDVCGEGVRQTFRIVLEDEEVEPPVVRNLAVEPGEWTTLEVDLRKATQARGLDLKRMAALYVIVSQGRPIRARLDNIRLCRKGTAAAFKVVRDDSPQLLPAYYGASPGPQPARLPAGRPDRSPIALAQPFVIPVQDEVARAPQAAGSVVKPGTAYLAVTPCGWAAAYDNRHLLVGFTGSGGRNVFAMQSLDAGKTWRGLDGGERATTVPVPNPDHGAGRGDVVGKRADVLLLTSLGCAGTCVPAMRQFAQKLTFTGEGWTLRPDPALVDCDGRHCGSNQSIVRLADGRLWCGYGLVGRLGRIGIDVRYSDDDGRVWRSWRPGRSGTIPGSFHPGRGPATYQYEEPCLVPYGDKGIACLWHERPDGTRIGDLKWARFDGTEWSAPETVALGRAVPGKYVASRPPVHAVSLGGKEIFLVSSRFPGVLHHARGEWKKEAAGIPAGGRISAAGEAVLVFSASPQEPKAKDGGIVIRCWRRSASGQWSGPRELAREDAPLTWSKSRPSFVVQAYAPPNFVPIAWTCKDKGWIKFLRVPVDLPMPSAPEGGAKPAAASEPAPAPDAKPQAGTPIRVLFIGNSYTMYNRMVDMLAALARDAGQPRALACTQIIVGGCTFEGHWSRAKTMEPLRAGGWDIVVLQGHHDGPLYPAKRASMVAYGSKLGAEVNAGKARLIYYMTWPKRKVADKAGQIETIKDAYLALSEKTGGEIAPAGLAFVKALEKRPDLAERMYWPDGYHPGKLASYLIACTMYATIYGRSPVGLPRRVYLTSAARKRRQAHLEVDAETAKLLQSIAASSVREIRKAVARAASRPGRS